MKKLFILFLLLGCTTMFAQQWNAKSLATLEKSPSAMHFPTVNDGWVCGSDASIYHTSDAGKTWEAQTSNFYSTLYDIYFINNQVGWAVGERRAVCLTTDGGKNWTLKQATVMTDTSFAFQKVYFFNATTGIALASKSTSAGKILKTTDGGNTWLIKLEVNKSLLGLSFGTATNGVVTGKDANTIYYTTDAGDTWTQAGAVTLPAVYTRSDLWAVFMVDANTAFASGWGSDAAGLQPNFYLKSTDGGKTWTNMEQKEENKTYYNNNFIYFKDANTGYAFGGSSSTIGGKLSITTDGGVNWVPTQLKSSTDMKCASIFSDRVYFLGSTNMVFRADDIKGTNLTNLTNMNSALSTVKFASSKVGFIGSNTTSAFFKTTDGGATWQTKQFVYEPTVPLNTKFGQWRDLVCFDENNLIMVGSRRIISKSTNGGDTWSVLLADTNVTTGYSFNSITFTDQNKGWAIARHGGTSAAGYNYGIYKTVDGGTTWSFKTGSKELLGIDFADANNGIAVGRIGNMMYTTDGGDTWTTATSPAPSSTFYSVKFLSSSKALAVSDSGKVAVSTDAGKTWSLVSSVQTGFPLYRFNELYVKDAQNIFICGYTQVPSLTGTLIKSTDGGSTFTNLSDPAIFTNNMVDFTIDPNGVMWGIASSGSLVFSTKSLNAVETINNIIPDSYELLQNYPNPFNPTTTISWKMMNQGKVEIRVYDMLGKEIKTLVNETKDAGTYKVTWDGKNNFGKTVSTGIYYYILKANNFFDVKKMMMMK